MVSSYQLLQVLSATVLIVVLSKTANCLCYLNVSSEGTQVSRVSHLLSANETFHRFYACAPQQLRLRSSFRI